MKAGGDLLAQFVYRGLQVDGLDFAPRRHDVLDRDVLKVKEIEQDGPVLLGNELAGFEHDGT